MSIYNAIYNAFKQGNATGLRYAIALVIVVILIMAITKALNLTEPAWALVSGVICIELEVEQGLLIALLRVLATIVGVIIALLVLFAIGPRYTGMVVGIFIATLVSFYTIPLKSWKPAATTSIIVLVAGLEQNSITFAETLAFKRAIEVIIGSLVAGIISYLFKQRPSVQPSP